jgi:hypothetical protein
MIELNLFINPLFFTKWGNKVDNNIEDLGLKIITGGNIARFVKITTENYFEEIIKAPLKELIEYIDTMEREIEQRAKNNNFYYTDTLNSGEKIRYAYNDKVEEIWKYETTFPSIFRNSSLTSIYSFFEERLLSICFSAEEKLQLKKVFQFQKEQKANGIFLAEKYLINICKVNYDLVSNEWKIIKDFNQIRNCIVHARGNIKDPFYEKGDKANHLRRSIESLNSRGIAVNGDLLFLNKEACYELIGATEKVLEHSYNEFLDKIFNLK